VVNLERAYLSIYVSAGNFNDICQADMDSQLRSRVKRTDNDCSTSNSTSSLERWAEKIRLSKVRRTPASSYLETKRSSMTVRSLKRSSNQRPRPWK
jgi:hypothetical protein